MIVARSNFTKQWGRSRGAPRASGTRTLTLVALVVASIPSCFGQGKFLRQLFVVYVSQVVLLWFVFLEVRHVK